jgi:hypothetical protein
MAIQSRNLLAIAVHVALGTSLPAMAGEPDEADDRVTELGKIAVDVEVRRSSRSASITTF